MRRSGKAVHSIVAIVVRPLILVQNQHPNRRAERHAKFGAGLDLHRVLLISGRGQFALAGAPARELRLDVCLRELHSRWDAIDDTAH